MEERLHILLVEDSPADAFLLQESLAQVEHPPRVIHVEKLDEALSYLKNKTSDAILLDLALPDSTGLGSLERTNAAAEWVPIIILTGLEDEALGIDAVRKGAQDYLIKGQTDARQLMQTIHRAIERKRLERALAQSAQRSLLLAEVSAKVVAQTNLKGLLTTVVDASRRLTSARISCAGAVFEKGRFRYREFSNSDRVDCGTFQEGAWSDEAVLSMIADNESMRLSEEELKSKLRQSGFPEAAGILRGFLGARLVDVGCQTLGSIVVSDKERGEDFTQEDETLLRQLALITSLAAQHIESRTEAEAASIAKSQFLANMSHELRTPMNAILGMTDLALNEDIPILVRDYLQTARESADLLLEFLNGILDLSRLEAGRFDLESTVFSLHKAVEQVVKTLRVRAGEKGLALICNLPSRVPDQLVGDPLRFRQILMNLVDNAIKFTHAGKVVVKADLEEQTEEMATLSFSISDTGIGISSEDQDRIFLAFTQADASTTRNYGGSGLGLTIVRRLVELMDGRIRVESKANEGSTFYFTIRLKIPQRTEKQKPEIPKFSPSLYPQRTLRVLLAEDTPTNQKLAEYLLTKRGHVVEVARDGRNALELVQKRDYDVVLMDVQMPVMDGFQATAAIRALEDPVKANLPIIAMTAHALKEDADLCFRAGMDAYISKPINADELFELVEFLGEADAEAKYREEAAETGVIAPEPLAAGSLGIRQDVPRSGDETPPAFSLEEAVNKCFGKYDFFLDMVDGFFEEADEAAELMRRARSAKNNDEVRRIAHRLKNTVLYLGAQRVITAIGNVESAAKASQDGVLGEALIALDLRLLELKNSLAPYRGQSAAASNRSG